MTSQTSQTGQTARTEPTDEERAAAARMLELIGGLHISRALNCVAELGIPDRLADGPLTASELARATQTHEPSLYRVLRLLAALGVLAEPAPHTFQLTLLGDRLRTGVPASVRSWATLTDTIGFAAFEPILEMVRTGTSGSQIVYGMGGMERVHQDPERGPRFDAAMSERTWAFAPSVADRYDFAGLRTVADIGGGQGVLLATILHAHQLLRGILFDVAAVTGSAADLLRGASVADRCQVITGDFFRSVPAGADAYLMANVLHDWDDDQSRQILANCRQAMAPGGRVLIIERLIPDDPAAAVPVLVSDLNMLVLTGGLERTIAEYHALLTAAGFRPGAVLPVTPPYGVIEGFAG
jgi:orsellinic acid C2-O-methyltransferase